MGIREKISEAFPSHWAFTAIRIIVSLGVILRGYDISLFGCAYLAVNRYAFRY